MHNHSTLPTARPEMYNNTIYFEAIKNIKEGRGLRFSTSMGKKGSGDFLFASSNALWRATLEKLDFAPLNNVDYAGGIIVTDWFSEGSNLSLIHI